MMKMPDETGSPSTIIYRMLPIVRLLLFTCLFLALAFDGFYVTLYIVIFFTDISPLTSGSYHPYHKEKLIISLACLLTALIAAVACIRESFRLSLLSTILLLTNLTIQFVLCVALYDPMDLMDCVLVLITSFCTVFTLIFAVLLKRTAIP
ncbi:hypothetical protein HDE_04988 [Halotydeus destructor]|nr:hypothetical protein HDE_04988 [Halotydeus destructor]